ncbi:MAG: hypothetical protein H6654_08200 [Ardenticatenaceae bacterium]|nr:hypothetical protein [Anaerolineales bacterium]MCB8940503.1 hypothetical protein [Ardenticatenaceae bacterium]MCB8973524.1 hypothetical protein [Ardenticatenaceae bacterium]
MKQQLFFKWLALAAVVEWLLVRTLTRAAIHVPKSPGMIAGYTAVNQIGLVSATFVGLLALLLLLWIAWQNRRDSWLPLPLVGLALLSVLFLFIVPPAWLALLYQLLALSAVLLLCARVFGEGGEGTNGEERRRQGTAALLFPAAALIAGLLVQLLPNLYALLGWPGPPPLTAVFFNMGEIFVVGSVAVWWWGYGRSHAWQHWVLAAVPALLFALSFWRDPAMTGILTIWSTGLTLFLPWPIYALALWLAGVTVLAAWSHHPSVAYAILLLIAAGYTPQLSSQLFSALIALWLLASATPVAQMASQPVTTPLPAYRG